MLMNKNIYNIIRDIAKRLLCAMTLLTFVVVSAYPEIIGQKEYPEQSFRQESYHDIESVSIEPETPARLSVGTNLLYWALMAPNIAAEYYFPNSRWSVSGTFTMPWWKRKSKHQYYQIRQYLVEGRYRIKTMSSEAGHFLGANIHGGVYDLENRKTGYYGEFVGTSLLYGYKLFLNKKMALEFTIGGGYIYTNYDKYTPMDNCYVYLSTHKTHYWGITKAGVSLVWSIFKKQR